MSSTYKTALITQHHYKMQGVHTFGLQLTEDAMRLMKWHLYRRANFSRDQTSVSLPALAHCSQRLITGHSLPSEARQAITGALPFSVMVPGCRMLARGSVPSEGWHLLPFFACLKLHHLIFKRQFIAAFHCVFHYRVGGLLYYLLSLLFCCNSIVYERSLVSLLGRSCSSGAEHNALHMLKVPGSFAAISKTASKTPPEPWRAAVSHCR